LIYLIDQAAYHFLPQLELIDVRRRLAMIGWTNMDDCLPDSPYCTAFGGSITLNRDPGQDCNSIWIVFNGDATLGTCNFHVTAAITPCQFVYLDIGIYDDHMNLQDCGLWYLTNQAHWNPSLYTFPYTYSCPFTSGTGRIDFDDHQDNCYCIHDNPEERNTRRHCYCIVTVSA
jgi:hypothetical protein